MNLSLYERETIIRYSEGEQLASVYTHNKALIRKLDKLARDRPEECRLEQVGHGGKSAAFTVPKQWVKINPPRKLTESQRQALENARNASRNAARAEVAALL